MSRLCGSAPTLAVTLSLLATSAARQMPAADEVLRVDSPVERELAAGESHTYRIPLEAGHFVRILVDQKDLFVRVLLTAPDGRPLVSSASRHRLRPERLATFAKAAGDYRVTVAAISGGADRGEYRIRIDALRPGGPLDRRRSLAEQAVSEALQLQGKGTKESLEAAIGRLEEALGHWQAADDRRDEAQALDRLGSLHAALGDPGTAAGFHRRALATYQALADRLGEAEALNNVGVRLFSLSEFPEAARHFQLALPIQREIGDLQGLASTLNNLGSLFWARSDPQKGLDFYEQVIPLRRELRDRAGEARTLNNIGTVLEHLGDYQRALDSYRAALALRRAVGDQRGEAVTLSNLGLFDYRLGRFSEALRSLEEALRLRRIVGDKQGEAATLRALAQAHGALGDRPTALARAEEAAALHRTAGDRKGEGFTLAIAARLNRERGDHAAALRDGTAASELCRSIGVPRCRALALGEMGRTTTATGDFDRAAEHLETALQIHRAMLDTAGEAAATLALARLERARGRLDVARTHAETTLSLVESERSRFASEELRSSYLAARHDSYRFLTDLLMDLHAQEPGRGHDATALETSERAHARSLLDLLVEAGAEIREGVDSHLLAEERRLQQRVNAVDANRLRLLDRDARGTKVAESEKELRQLLTQLRELRGRIRIESPRYAALTQPQPVDVETIQRDLLDDETVLLQYALGDERSFLWAVTRRSVTSYVLPSRAVLEAAARRVHGLLTVSHTRQRRREADRATGELARVLLVPAADHLDAKRIAVVVDGALQFVPFGALPFDGQPLILQREVVHLPSASTLAVLRREISGRAPAPKSVAVFADPVLTATDPRVHASAHPLAPAADASGETTTMRPVSDLLRSSRESGLDRFERLAFTRREAEVIRALAGKTETHVALDFEASRAAAMETDLARYRIVHFATHGLLNTLHPGLSGLVLSLVDRQGLPQDGFLRSHDIYNLRLGADLVVLSACRTALGQEIRGEGLINLVRGFMYAGAPRVVASLWDVRDEATAELMKRFYSGILSGALPPAAALRAAQVSMWKDDRWSAPYYWAGFVLQGEWR